MTFVEAAGLALPRAVGRRIAFSDLRARLGDRRVRSGAGRGRARRRYEDFLTGPAVDVGDVRLPDAGPDRRPRWDLNQLHASLNEHRQERNLTWASLADELRCTPSRLTNLRKARQADMDLTMRITASRIRSSSRPRRSFTLNAGNDGPSPRPVDPHIAANRVRSARARFVNRALVSISKSRVKVQSVAAAARVRSQRVTSSGRRDGRAQRGEGRIDVPAAGQQDDACSFVFEWDEAHANDRTASAAPFRESVLVTHPAR